MEKTAIVTGGSRGIGYAIAKRLGLDGFRVVILATGEQEKYEEALKALNNVYDSAGGKSDAEAGMDWQKDFIRNGNPPGRDIGKRHCKKDCGTGTGEHMTLLREREIRTIVIGTGADWRAVRPIPEPDYFFETQRRAYRDTFLAQ